MKNLTTCLQETWLSPAKNLMNRLNYHKKFSLLLLILVLPLILMVYFLFSEINIWRNFAHKEREGVLYIFALRGFLEPLQKHRGLFNAYQRGDHTLKGRLAEEERRIDEAIDKVDVVDHLFGAALVTHKQWNAIKVSYRDVENTTPHLSPEESFERHSALIADVLSLFIHAGDTSNLITDPDLDAYYLMDTLVTKLPSVLEGLGQLRGLGTGYAVTGANTVEDRTRLIILIKDTEKLTSQMKRGLFVVFRANPTVQECLGSRLEGSMTSSQTFLYTAETQLRKASIPMGAAEYFTQGTNAMEGYFSLFDETTSVLDRLLEVRLTNYFKKQAYISIFVLFIFLVVLYLYMGFYRAVMGTVTQMESAAQRMIEGEGEEDTMVLENQDELGMVTRSFNRIAGQLRKECIQTREESSRAHMAETRLRTQYAVSRVLVEASSIKEAAPKILQAVCDGFGWDLSNLWQMDEKEGFLRCEASYTRDAHAFPGFIKLSREITFSPSVGLPGRVWSSGKPSWVIDVRKDDNFPRYQMADKEGLCTGLCFPLRVGQKIIAVIELFNRKEIKPYRDQLHMLESIGNQIGQFHERKKAEEGLQTIEEMYKNILDSISDMVLCKGSKSRIVWANKAFRDYYGMANEELKGLTDSPINESDYTAQYIKDDTYVFETGKTLDIPDEPVTRFDGVVRHFHTVKSAILDSQGKTFLTVGVSRDITDRKNMEDAMLQTEKLAGVGELAAGVAHELNNPLTGILGFTQLLLEDTSLTSQQKQDVETIHTQSQRCRGIIQNLLQFCRRSPAASKQCVDLREVVKNTLTLVRYEMSVTSIELKEIYPSQPVNVWANTNQLQQVILNLVTNASQALENSPEKKITVTLEGQEDAIRLSVADTGGGIPKDIQDKIFDPFFTTKPTGKGTGLGLSICYGIVKDHQGRFQVQSQTGVGTTMIIELPRYNAQASAAEDPTLQNKAA